ncbi:hypothetical protein SAMN02799625_04600 [Methylobacterium sp. UNC300MFChir4.1]|uniref:hypothetical protein n=1 Tax=Methylobacterium sp. UNC300MFChir4.1 TaxID=1502747 RepID=UPI0008BF77BD|nr:hypothetical protein [Methylobacterium sp. UNC300MFChir4.1]SEP07999.1 hypothetical protein SAMN02799625_04600 [Methylobacterium sp. UNC300MFChir4.1]
MRVQAMTIPAAAGPATRGTPRARLLLAALTILALPLAFVAAARIPAAPVDPDLVRVIRFMALLKGGFALAALAGCFWRLGQPAGWRSAVYVAGPPLMALGAGGLWSLRDPGLAALGLHLGLFAVLAAALTDREALPDRLRAARRQIVS